MFTVDKRQLQKLSKHFAKLEKRIPMSIAGILNNQADGTRNTALEEIYRTMNIRAKSFISSRIRYTKATPSLLESVVGSIEAGEGKTKFTALEEQERGGDFARERYISKMARGGNAAKMVRAQARLKKTSKFYKPTDYRGRYRSGFRMPSGRHAKARGMIRSLSRMGYRKPFIIEGHDTLPSGLWMLRGRRDQQQLKLLQQFGVGLKVGRRPWMRPAIDLFFRRWHSKRDWSYHFGQFARRFK